MMVCCRWCTEVLKGRIVVLRSGFHRVADGSGRLNGLAPGTHGNGSRPCSLVAAGDDGRVSLGLIVEAANGKSVAHCNEARNHAGRQLAGAVGSRVCDLLGRGSQSDAHSVCRRSGFMPSVFVFSSPRGGLATATGRPSQFAPLLSSFCLGLSPADALRLRRERTCSRTCVRFPQPLTCHRVGGKATPLATHKTSQLDGGFRSHFWRL